MPDSGLMDKAHCKAESPESYGYQGLPEVSVRTSYFQKLWFAVRNKGYWMILAMRGLPVRRKAKIEARA